VQFVRLNAAADAVCPFDAKEPPHFQERLMLPSRGGTLRMNLCAQLIILHRACFFILLRAPPYAPLCARRFRS